MALITFNRQKFEKEIGKADEKMQGMIAMFGTPVESVNEKEIQIEISPNRPDMLSYEGFKRGFLAYLNKNTGLKKYKVNPPEKNYNVIIDSSVKLVRPYTACAIVRGLQLDDGKIKEIIDVQEKLHFTVGRKRRKVAIGIYPLEKIKLPITYKAIEPDKIKFIPLESEKEMSGLEILQKHPTGKEHDHLLSGKERFPVFVDAEQNVLSMPPIINSKLTGKITEGTKDIFIECSGFDFEILKKVLNILATTFADMGGKIYQMELQSGRKKEITPDLREEEMKISLENANKLLGLNLNEKQVKQFLERMGYEYSNGKVKIPAWRTDILHEVDLIEDIAIAYGYDNFVSEIPAISTIGEENPKEIIKRKIAEILAGLNILEVSSYHLTTKEHQFKKMNAQEENFIEVEDSKTDYSILRKNLSHFLMKILAENIDAEYPQRIFELGRIFMPEEKEHLALAISPGNFTESKQIIEYLFKMLNLEIKIQEPGKIPAHFVDGRTAKIIFNGKEIGFVGEIHPKILRNWRIKMPVALFEISLEEIFEKLDG